MTRMCVPAEDRELTRDPHPQGGEEHPELRRIRKQSEAFLIDRLCRVMNVSPCGVLVFRSHPAGRRQHVDMAVLAQLKEHSRLSLGTSGRPRMMEELKEVWGDAGHRRVGQLMRANGFFVEGTRKFKAIMDIDHTFNIAPNLLDRDFTADQPNQKWAGDVSYIWTREGWWYLAAILDQHSQRVIAPRDLHANPFRVTVGPSATA